VRLITALVFAAKSDGHIDDHERANIEAQLRAANIDVQARVLIDQALAQPLDPQRLAEGIVDPQEALEIYYVSCAVIDIDHFMERSYLNAWVRLWRCQKMSGPTSNRISSHKNRR
jgi:uncharacterized membrane protein YebE (DUF533 family)